MSSLPSASVSLREEMRALKRARILTEASQLFSERGFVGTTLEAIAERVGSSKPFIYQFFENKHAILVAMYDRELRDSLAVLRDARNTSGTPAERLQRFVELAVCKNVRNQALTDLFAHEEKHLPAEKLREIRSLEAQFNDTLTRVVDAGVKSGDFDVPDAAIAARSVMGMLQWVKRWYHPDGALGVDEISAQLHEYARRIVGMAARKTGRTARGRERSSGRKVAVSLKTRTS